MITTELHIHSTFSDGGLTPKEILIKAKQASIRILSITDHDEIGAYEVALPYAKEYGIELIPGIELNTDGEDGELHILGYFFNPHHPKIIEHISWRKQERKEWVEKIIKRLNELGYPITIENVKKHVPGGIIVRTHIAEELVQMGHFMDAKTAYKELLVKGKPAFVKRAPFSAKDAIHLIQSCGGEAFLAHPGAYPFSINEKNLLSYGIDGIEVYHSKHDENDVEYWLRFTKMHGLKVSGGSDFHGTASRKCAPIGSVQIDSESKIHWLKWSELSL